MAAIWGDETQQTECAVVFSSLIWKIGVKMYPF